jgi:WD40 repeat protein
LHLRNTRFRDAVADVASAVRGIPKDELESEEVRQHRRTLRTAWTAGIALLLLGVAATVAAVIAIDQSNEAGDQRDEAQRQAEIARQNEQAALESERLAQQQTKVAEQQQRLAEEQRALAEQQSRLSFARALAANALAEVSRDDDRALLLAMAAAFVTSSADEPILPEALDALHRSLGGHRILARLQGGGGPDLAWSEDGGRLATIPPGLSANDATIWVTSTAERFATLPGDSPVTGVTWSADGRLVATTHRSGLVNVWLGGAQPPLVSLENSRSVDSPVFDHRGRLLAVDEAGPLVRVWNVILQEPAWELDVGVSGPMSFNADGTLLAIQERRPDAASVWDMTTGELVWALPEHDFPVDIAFDPSSSLLATLYPDPGRVTLWDTETRAEVLSYETLASPRVMAWSPDGRAIAVAGEARVIEVFDARTGVRLLELPGHAADVSALAFGCSGGLCSDRDKVTSGAAEIFLASTDLSGETLLWDLDPDGGGHAVAVGGSAVVGARLLEGDSVVLVNNAAGQVMRVDLDGADVLSLDGPQFWPIPVTMSADESVAILTAPGEAVVFNPATLEVIRSYGDLLPFAIDSTGSMMAVDNFGDGEPIVLGLQMGEEILYVEDPDLVGGDDQLIDAEFSPDDSLLAVSSSSGSFRLYDMATGMLLGRTGPDWPVVPGQVTFSSDGALLAFSDSSGRVVVVAVAPLIAGEDDEAWLLADFTGLDGDILELKFTPDDSMLAMSGLDGTINFWSTLDWQRVFTLDVGGQTASLDFTADGRQLMTPAGTSNRLFFFVLDPDELLDLARERVTRGFTEEECRTFLLVDSCADAPPGIPGVG